MEDLVEVCTEVRRWDSVCAVDFWDTDDATVVCRHLGRSTTGKYNCLLYHMNITRCCLQELEQKRVHTTVTPHKCT